MWEMKRCLLIVSVECLKPGEWMWSFSDRQPTSGRGEECSPSMTHSKVYERMYLLCLMRRNYLRCSLWNGKTNFAESDLESVNTTLIVWLFQVDTLRLAISYIQFLTELIEATKLEEEALGQTKIIISCGNLCYNGVTTPVTGHSLSWKKDGATSGSRVQTTATWFPEKEELTQEYWSPDWQVYRHGDIMPGEQSTQHSTATAYRSSTYVDDLWAY